MKKKNLYDMNTDHTILNFKGQINILCILQIFTLYKTDVTLFCSHAVYTFQHHCFEQYKKVNFKMIPQRLIL